MYTPRHNRIIFAVFCLLSLGILVASLISPLVRGFTSAPLRDLLLPPPDPVLVTIDYSTEKEQWLEEAVAQFNTQNRMINGHPIEIRLSKAGSREIYTSILSGESRPVMISPASTLQINILEQLSTSQFGKPVVHPSATGNCQPVLSTPLVVVAWADRAEALWNGRPSRQLWYQIHDAVVDSQGWSSYGHPEWGYVKFGHTDPLKSNSGFMTLLELAYSYYGKTSNLSEADILDPDFQEWLLNMENAISAFGESTGTYMREIVSYGPSMYDMVAVYEATAIENLQNAAGRYGELRVYYPPSTILSDHPFCVLDADWVSNDQTTAAQEFIEFLLSPEIQQLALDYGFRPVDPSIPLDGPQSPFVLNAGNGLQVDLPPQVSIPDGNTLNTLLDFWSRNVSR